MKKLSVIEQKELSGKINSLMDVNKTKQEKIKEKLFGKKNYPLKQLLQQLNKENNDLTEELLKARDIVKELKKQLSYYENKELYETLNNDLKVRREILRNQ